MPVTNLDKMIGSLSNKKHAQVFLLFWLITFVIYLPAAKAGMVGDMPYFIHDYNTKSFRMFLNPGNGIALYQVAFLNFYLLIKFFGANLWLWHLFYITMHALNAIILFKFFGRLLSDSKIDNAWFIAIIAAMLFLVSPQASEVVVWKASNHYSVTTAIIFIIMLYVQKFISNQKPAYALITACLFFYSMFSHEFFYLIPWFVLLLILWYRVVLGYDKKIIHRSFLYFFLPLLLLFIFHLALLQLVKHTFISHFGKLERMSVFYYLDKPLKYLFHVLLFGRFFPDDWRNKVYAICESKFTIISFYSILLCFWGYFIFRLKQVKINLKVLVLISIYLMMIFIFLSPVYFADSQVVCYDRYAYPSLGFVSLFFVIMAGFIRWKLLRAILIIAYATLSVLLSFKVNLYWKKSAYVINHLLNNLPDPADKTILLLNLPDDLNGVPMIAAEDEGRYKIMRNNLTPYTVSNPIYDVEAYKMSDMEDGAHIKVINDSVLHVTLNQWGTWWLYSMTGSVSYENKEYKVNMIDEGHWYELTLKYPANQYLLLYQAGAQWKVVDWNKKNIDQY